MVEHLKEAKEVTKGRRAGGKEYLFTWANQVFYSRDVGDKTHKSVRRIKLQSLPREFRLKVVKNAGTWVRRTWADTQKRRKNHE
jgi:hypothetical protein